jgi:lysophospholipase L1-like esterase
MPDRIQVELISAADATASGEAGSIDWSRFRWRMLAQGDSWFSIGALPPNFTTRIFESMRLTDRAAIVNCAQPGTKLRRMVDSAGARDFKRLFVGRLALKWDAILFSGGGNDLIEAAGSPVDAPLAQRLLRTRAERGQGADAAAHLSEPGWQTFAAHLGSVFERLIDTRDAGINRHVPLLLHNYAAVTPRNAPAFPGTQAWLWPVMQRYDIDPTMHEAVSDMLTQRLAQLLEDLAAARRQRDPQANVHVFDSLGSAGIVRAAAGETGESGDWENEIHLTPGGYRKCARLWEGVLDRTLG